jgi:hypothetical protein
MAMNSAVTAIPVPKASEISRHLSGADYHDSYQVAIESSTQSALALYLDVVTRTPAWINTLMAMRNKTVLLVGLKNLGHLGAIDRSKPAQAYRVGDRVGIFSLLHLEDSEVILGDSDKHLRVQVSVFKLKDGERGAIAVSTVVHIHNLLGRVYMAIVVPLHKLIVPAVLCRVRAGNTETQRCASSSDKH